MNTNTNTHVTVRRAVTHTDDGMTFLNVTLSNGEREEIQTYAGIDNAIRIYNNAVPAALELPAEIVERLREQSA